MCYVFYTDLQGRLPPGPVYSRGPGLSLALSVLGDTARQNYFRRKRPIVRATYHAIHPPVLHLM